MNQDLSLRGIKLKRSSMVMSRRSRNLRTPTENCSSPNRQGSTSVLGVRHWTNSAYKLVPRLSLFAVALVTGVYFLQSDYAACGFSAAAPTNRAYKDSDWNDIYSCLSYSASRYKDIRDTLDYTYHEQYPMERIHIQDDIIDSILQTPTCNKRPRRRQDGQQWIVFTAGAMGSGKSHTIHELHEKSLFPLASFVLVDPDKIRHRLPEFDRFVEEFPTKAGEWTRKESGLISEVLTEAALRTRHNVLVDGSLRDATWYQEYFSKIRRQHPNLHIAILHIVAPRATVLERAEARAKITGRVVPQQLLESSLEQVPKSVAQLRLRG